MSLQDLPLLVCLNITHVLQSMMLNGIKTHVLKCIYNNGASMRADDETNKNDTIIVTCYNISFAKLIDNIKRKK